MLRSMTGYGRAEGPVGEGQVTLEARSVNNRHLDLRLHIPRTLMSLEKAFNDRVRERVQRGRVEVYLNQDHPIGQQTLTLDHDLLETYLQETQNVARRLAEQDLGSQAVDPLRLLLCNGVVNYHEAPMDQSTLQNEIEAVLDAALDALLVAREQEGARLEADLRARLAALREHLAPIDAARGKVAEGIRERLRERLNDELNDVPVDESRLAHELVFYVDRADINEEVVRLQAHFDGFDALLARNVPDAAYQPVGKEVDFMLQEMFREVNTIGSKANLLEITEHVVQMKSEIEKMREQAQNVE